MIKRWMCKLIGHKHWSIAKKVTTGVYDVVYTCRRCGFIKNVTHRPMDVDEMNYWEWLTAAEEQHQNKVQK